MKNINLLDYLKTPAVAPLGSFFCPEPRLDNGMSHIYCAWSGVTPWNSSSTETEIIDNDFIPWGEYFDLSARPVPKVVLMGSWFGVCPWKD
jgi:hypothetical protein